MARKSKKKRRYSKGAGNEVEKEMRRYKKGTAKSGRGGKGGKVKSRKQAIAIGLSKARRAGVDLPPPKKGQTSERTRKSAARAYARGHGEPPKRSRPGARWRRRPAPSCCTAWPTLSPRPGRSWR